MRHPLAMLAPAAFVSGCSLIYNPGNIDRPPPDGRVFADVGIDVEIRADANPAALELTEAHPTTIYEGTGTGGSRPAVVVLRGKQFASDPSGNLAVTLVPDTPDVVTLESFEVSGNGDYIALAIIAPVSDTCGGGTNVTIDITVSQSDGLGGTVTQTLDDAVVLACLNELDAVPTEAVDPLYSRIDIAGPLVLAGAAGSPLLLRSASYIKIAGDVDVSAAGQQPGPGGGRGGNATKTGAGPKPGGGTAALGAHGGGAGFVTSGGAGAGSLTGAGGGGGGMTGDPWLASYATNASSGGGGGGDGALGSGGAGGGGGGTVELTAPGDIEIAGSVLANGASAGAGAGGGGAGGAGSGGVILVRAGTTLTLANVSVAAGSKVRSGGTSSDGRVRIDAAKGDYPAGGTECTLPFQPTCTKTRGPMFVDVPTRTTIQTPAIMLRGTPNDASSTLRVFDKNGDPVAGMTYTPVFGTTGNATLTPVLKAGYNNICVWVEGGAPGDALPQSRNCVEIGYLPP